MGNTIRLAAGMALTMVATGARAEPFVDIFVGRSAIESRNLDLQADEARINGVVVPADARVRLFDVKTTKDPLVGGRIGAWFGRHLGLALDVSTLDPDVKAQTLEATANLRFDEDVFGERVTIDPGQNVAVSIPKVSVPTTATIAALVMVRFPLGPDDVHPARRIAPYAFAGPVWLITDSSLDGSLGLRAGGGVKVPVAGPFALFAEYRYTRVNADAVAGRIAGSVQGVSGTTGDIRVDLPIRNHTGAAGLSISF